MSKGVSVPAATTGRELREMLARLSPADDERVNLISSGGRVVFQTGTPGGPEDVEAPSDPDSQVGRQDSLIEPASEFDDPPAHPTDLPDTIPQMLDESAREATERAEAGELDALAGDGLDAGDD